MPAKIFHRLTPLTQRRVEVFFNNRRAKWSLYIFSMLFVISMLANIIANDKPIIIKFNSGLYFPFIKTYPETTFGGDFETETDYTDPYVQDLINAQGWIINAPIPYSYHTHISNLAKPAPSAPTQKNWLGTDDQARDVLARVIYGYRISILFALALTIGSSLIGVFVGALQGYFGGKIDLIGQRFLEIWSGLPELYLLIILSSIISPSFLWLLIIMLTFSWTRLVDLVRAECLRARNFEYVKAAKALGVPDLTIMVRHVLPNAMVATMTYIPFILAGSVSTLTALDFLGFGLPPGSASLGELVMQGKNNLQAPWLGLTAFMVLSIMLTLIVFIGEGVRDAFDPRLKV